MSESWDRVILVWKRSNIVVRPGVSAGAIEAFQEKYGVILPDDVREYFLTADGTGYDMDEGLYRFWPLEEVKPVHEELVDTERFSYPDRFAYPNCFVFADHCINCWNYAMKLTMDRTQPAAVFRVTGTDPPGEQMASSFREFMMRYADNPDNII